jgi:hypothetical protein
LCYEVPHANLLKYPAPLRPLSPGVLLHLISDDVTCLDIDHLALSSTNLRNNYVNG